MNLSTKSEAVNIVISLDLESGRNAARKEGMRRAEGIGNRRKEMGGFFLVVARKKDLIRGKAL